MNFLFLLDSEKTTSTKVRCSLISTSNKSLSIEDVRTEITKQFNKLKPASLCQPLEKACAPGPPGKKGNKGSRGKRGVQGIKGKKVVKGKMGLPGRHGQQGIMRNQGAKGEKGEKGKPLYKAIMKSKNMLANGRISCDDHRNCLFAHIFFLNAFIQPSVGFLFLALTFIGLLAHSIFPCYFCSCLVGWLVGSFPPWLRRLSPQYVC